MEVGDLQDDPAISAIVWIGRPHERKIEGYEIGNLDLLIILRSAMSYFICYIPVFFMARLYMLRIG